MLRAAERIGPPSTVYWEVTQRCNLSCAYCYAPKSQSTPCELSTSRITEILDELSREAVFRIVIGGGEPFLRNDLPLLLSETKGRFRTLISTSGCGVVSSALPVLRDLGRTVAVQVSMDGPPSVHDSIRGPGSYSAALDTLVKLRNAGIPTRIRFTYYGQRLDDFVYLIGLAERTGVEAVSVGRLVELRHGEASPREFLDAESQRRMIEAIRALGEQYLGPVRILTPRLPGQASHQRGRKVGGNNRTTDFNCGAGTSICAIGPTGDVLPCSFLRDFVFGNLEHHTFHAIWFESVTGADFRSELSAPIENSSWKCRCCECRSVCAGGCRASAYARYHDLRAPDPLCPWA